MKTAGRTFLTSVARATTLDPAHLDFQSFPREEWKNADLVVAEVTSLPNQLSKAELPSGRMLELMRGDRVVGALGRRAATLECVGSYAAVESDLQLDLMTPGGLLGKITSQSSYLGLVPQLRYHGHVVVQGERANLGNYVGHLPTHESKIPVILVVGTSMSAGKTATARVLIRMLKQAGRRVAAAKLTGAARYRDILSMQDAGADHILDFVDAGLPSSICPEAEYVEALQQLLARVGTWDVDVLVAEAGASPLEPYNGAAALRLLTPQLRLTALSASDPYAVVGVMRAFGLVPDLVTGVATNTTAGIELIQKLTALPAFNVLQEDCWESLNALLLRSLQPD